MNNLSIECLSFRECSKGFLLGFANIRVNGWNMEISDIQLMEKDGVKFIKMPSRAYEKDGEKKYDCRAILKREKQTTRKLQNIENARQEGGAVCAI